LPAPQDPAPNAPTEPSTASSELAASPAAASRRGRAVATTDVREELALLDAARAAVSAGDDGRAMEILRRHREKYPAGSFRPEATAIKVEALVGLGRQTEARALAARFVAEHRGTLLAGRVAALVGIAEPARP
jgi:hypothetical protein